MCDVSYEIHSFLPFFCQSSIDVVELLAGNQIYENLFYRYFPVDATAEMLEEWRPLMCPFDVTMQKAITYFEIFLPTSLPPELHHKGFK